jgi:HEAT repeat protein
VRRRLQILVCLCLLGPAASGGADPLDRLDPGRYGPGTLVLAMEELEGYKPSQAVDLVLPLLGHEDPDVARTAGWLLRRMGSGPAGATAAGTVLSDPAATEAARVSAAVALGELRDSGGQGALTAALAGDPLPSVRAAAALALGALHRDGAAGALANALGSDPEPAVRRAAAEALGCVPDATAGPLSDALLDADPTVRVEAAWSLGRHRFREALGRLHGALADQDCRVGAAAAWALLQIADPQSQDALQAATGSSCRLTAQAAAWAISQL